jgi:DNA-directed RNA polymerase subunit RPC12/RpoP
MRTSPLYSFTLSFCKHSSTSIAGRLLKDLLLVQITKDGRSLKMPEETIDHFEIECRECGAKGYLVEKEWYEIGDVFPGDCADDGRTYFFSFEVKEGNFEVAQKNPNSYDHTIACDGCSSTKVAKKKVKTEKND